MTPLDSLIAQVKDRVLREKIEAALAEMKRKQRFGLVFEDHIPETTALFGLPVQPGSLVQRRDDLAAKTLYRVVEVTPRGRATIAPVSGGNSESVSTRELLAVKRFGEPMYPALTPLGVLRRGGPTNPHHAVINGENFHTLQLLTYLFERQVDCIYIDPPYNTGARDWKYNNRYVDKNDTWRHSKWLSFMEKRLRLAKRLLKPDGVLIVTIDENEVHHVGMLLESIFPEYLRHMVTAVINPKGTFKVNFGRVDEQLLFLVPDIGKDVITPRPALASETDKADDVGDRLLRNLIGLGKYDVEALLNDESSPLDAEEQDRLSSVMESDEEAELAEQETGGDTSEPPPPDYEDWFLRRRGQESSYRYQRPNQFYAILVDEDAKKVVGVGPLLGRDDPYRLRRDGDVITVYPIDNEGHERVWRYSRPTMQGYIDAGEIVVGTYNKTTRTWTLNHRKLKKDVRRHKTVWWEKRHDAGVHGTNVVNRLLGRRGVFPFPKSVYAVQDALAAIVRNRPHALIVDFFAGSGTTLHATCLLNAQDNGSRRCVLVTNNEVDEATAKQLCDEGYEKGDPEFEARGIFEQVCRPRCEAVISGRRPDRKRIDGTHLGGRPFAEGFPENVEFYRLNYLDPDDVDLGSQSNAILPALWIAAGGVGKREKADPKKPFSMPAGSTYGVLFKESRFRQFKAALEERPDVTHVWLVTDSEEAYAEMRSALPARLFVSMLYRDYLRNFRINTERNL